MSRKILPAFDAIENVEAAEALSEPFMRAQDYTILPEAKLDEAEPIAAGVAYISDDGEVEYGFALAEEADRPLAAVQEFAAGYDLVVGSYHAYAAEMTEDRGPDPTNARDDIIGKVRAEGLRAISGFAVFAAGGDEGEIETGFILARRVFEEIPLEARELFIESLKTPGSFEMASASLLSASSGPRSMQDIEEARRGIMQNSSAHQMYAVAKSALILPEPKVAKRLIAEDPRVGNFLTLPRKQRRKLLKEEEKIN